MHKHTNIRTAFLTRLGCTAAVLRVKTFQDFLAIPKNVRDGLTYASHKPFGKMLKEGLMQKHPRFVHKNVGHHWIRLTQDERGASLICYPKDNRKVILASFKIGASTEIKNISESVKDAFVVKSGKRQWILQAASTRVFTEWQSQILEVLKQFQSLNLGPSSTTNTSPSGKRPATTASPNIVLGNAATNKLIKSNDELRLRNDRLRSENDNLKAEIQELLEEQKNANADENDIESIRRKIVLEFSKERDNLVRDYELQHENLRSNIEDLHRQLEAKTAMEAGSSGLKTMFTEGFKLAGALGGKLLAEEELKVEIDSEKRMLDGMTEDEKASIKFVHRHLHKHEHKHIHHHRHVHIHDETEVPPVQYSETHTISHTITHTNTQFKIKRSFF